jgi:hypothetical protein
LSKKKVVSIERKASAKLVEEETGLPRSADFKDPLAAGKKKSR